MALFVNNIIVEVRFEAQHPEGEKQLAKLTIGQPENNGHSWICDVSTEGIGYDREFSSQGTDSLLALMSGLSGAQALLVRAKKDGWKFYYSDSSDEKSINDFFPIHLFQDSPMTKST